MKGKLLGKVSSALLVFLLSMPCTYAQEIAEPSVPIRDLLKPRFPRWVGSGCDIADIEEAVNSLESLDDEPWVVAWSTVAQKYEGKADRLLKQGKKNAAAKAYFTASLYYGIARYPCITSPAKKHAYEKYLETYLKAATSFKPPLERVAFPFEGKEIVGYLRVPDAGRRNPCVIVVGGVDGWKEEQQQACESLLKRGLATFAFDMPGTGESQWKLHPDNIKVFVAVVDYLTERPEIDANRIGIVGTSYGGYWSTYLPAVDQRIKAAVNIGGPVHHAFKQDRSQSISQSSVNQDFDMARTILIATGLQTPEEMAAFAAESSLVDKGLVAKIACPLLIINGKDDELVPIEDAYVLAEYGMPKELRIFPDDVHCAMKHTASDVRPLVARWLSEKLR